MSYGCNAGGTPYVFADLRMLLARASPDRAGDRLAGLAAESGEERVAARMALADLPLARFLDDPVAPSETLARLAPGIAPEMAAGVSKLMRNQDLIAVAKKISVVTRFRTTIGLPGRLCTRIQPSHPTDDLAGIGASILDGLMYGCGDACIGINLLRIVPNRPWRYSSGSRSCGNGSKYRSNLVCSPTLRQLCRYWSKVGRSILFFNP